MHPILAAALWSACAVACADHEANAPPPPVGSFTAAITCQATVTTGTLSCATAPPAVRRGIDPDVILGGQGTYVQLASSGTAYDAVTQAFTTNVTVQDLTAQPMATTDGTTADAGGIRVFVSSGPTTTAGSGTVTVANADGMGTFTGSVQPFWQYGGVLASGATSTSKLWRFTVPNTVTSFAFEVFVDTKLPVDNGVLRWTAVGSGTTRTLRGAGSSAVGVYAVGDGGTILFSNGTSWGAVSTGLSLSNINLYAVDANCADGIVYAVGDNGTIVHFDGATWSLQTSGVTDSLFAVSRLCSNTGGGGGAPVFAVGAHGVILYSADGTSWTRQTSPSTADLYFTAGGAVNSWLAAGAGGVLLQYDGTNWGLLNSNTTHDIRGATGGQNDIWLVGSGGTIEHSSDFATFTFSQQTSGTTQDLLDGDGNLAGTDEYVVGSAGTIIHWNAISWSAMASGTSADLKAIAGSGTNQWAVGAGGVILHGTR